MTNHLKFQIDRQSLTESDWIRNGIGNFSGYVLLFGNIVHHIVYLIDIPEINLNKTVKIQFIIESTSVRAGVKIHTCVDELL